MRWVASHPSHASLLPCQIRRSKLDLSPPSFSLAIHLIAKGARPVPCVFFMKCGVCATTRLSTLASKPSVTGCLPHANLGPDSRRSIGMHAHRRAKILRLRCESSQIGRTLPLSCTVGSTPRRSVSVDDAFLVRIGRTLYAFSKTALCDTQNFEFVVQRRDRLLVLLFLQVRNDSCRTSFVSC